MNVASSKFAAALIVVERRRVAGEICFNQIEIAIQIIIRCRDPHAGLRLSIRAQSASCFDCDVLKFPVLLVLVERAGGGIVGDINIGPAIVVEICSQHSEAVGAAGAENSRRVGNVGERAIAVVVIQNVFAALQSRRSARHHYALVKARARFRHGRSRQIEIDVVGDEQIEFAVAIVVDERAACVPARAFARHSCLLADVGEGTVTIVVVQNILAEVGNEQIVPSVVVVVADAHALPPAGMRDSGLRSHVGESSVAIVAEEM